MTNNQPPELLSDKELRQLSELFWRFHNDRLDDPTIKEMKPYIQPILDLINQQTQAAELWAKLKQTRRIRRHEVAIWGRTMNEGFYHQEEKMLKAQLASRLAALEGQQDKEGNDEL